MAVVVQRMVRADVAGVLFTCDPVHRRRDRMVVEAVFGLGEAAVSGQVTPDHYVLKRDGTVKRARVAVQPFAIVPVEDGGTEERALGADEGGAQKLDGGPAARARAHRRRPRAAARRPAGHRVGARGRRDLRAPGAAGDHVSEVLDRAQAWIAEVHPHARHLERTLDWLLELDPGRVGGAADRRRHARHRARLPGRRRRLGLRARLGLGRLQPLAPGSLRRARRARPARARRRRGPGARGRRPRARARGRRLARGRPPAGRRLAVVPGDDGPDDRRVGAERPRAARARRGQAAPDGRADQRRPPARARAGAAMLAPTLSRVRAANAPDQVRELAGMIRTGRMYRLARDRFPKMPLFPGHPTFEVVSYRTPQGIRAAGDQPWGPPNDACLGYMSELVMGTTHTGAHIDAHAHMTIGDEDRWHGGSARTDLGDFGPLRGDATEIPPLWRRGVLYDVPGHRGVESLPAGEPIAAAELRGDRARARRRRRRRRRGARAHRLPRALAGPGGARRAPRRRSRPVGGAAAGRPRGRSPPARTPRPTRSSRRPTAARPPTRSRCTRCC